MRENKVDQNLPIINFIKSLFDNNKFIPLHEPRFYGNEKIFKSMY